MQYADKVKMINDAEKVFVDCPVFEDYIKISKTEVMYMLGKHRDNDEIEFEMYAGFLFISRKIHIY